MSEATVKQLTGVCASITERNGWTEFEIDHGGQHTTKLSTKLQPLVELGRAARQELAVWTFKESDGNENPNRPGTFYKNRYLEKVEVGGTATATDNVVNTAQEFQANASASPTPAPRVYTPDLKDRMIVRQTALKAAAELITPGDDVEGIATQVIALAARFETWVYRDIDPVPFAPDLSDHDQAIPY